MGSKPSNVAAVKRDRPGSRRKLAGQHAQQRRLAHAIVAENAHELPLRHLEGNGVQNRYPAIAAMKRRNREHLT